MNYIKPIETRYKNYRFRSRLEARWAVFFDALGLEWQYEPEGYDLGEYGWYLPDFYLPYFNLFVEVKPTEKSEHKCDEFRTITGMPIFLCVGLPGEYYITLYCFSSNDSGGGISDDTFGIFTKDFTKYEFKTMFSSGLINKPNAVGVKFVVLGLLRDDTSLHDGDYNRLENVELLQEMFEYSPILEPHEAEARALVLYHRKMVKFESMAKAARFEHGESGV